MGWFGRRSHQSLPKEVRLSVPDNENDAFYFGDKSAVLQEVETSERQLTHTCVSDELTSLRASTLGQMGTREGLCF